jgi:hypothetical protein
MQKKSYYILFVLFIVTYGIAHFFFQYKSFATTEDIEKYYKWLSKSNRVFVYLPNDAKTIYPTKCL